MAKYTWNHIFQKKQKDGNVSVIIADDNTIIYPIEIAENFNNLFTSIGINLPKKISSTKKTFTDYLKKTNSEDFIIAPTTPDEISDLIQNLKSRKIMVPIVVPLKSWKYLKK